MNQSSSETEMHTGTVLYQGNDCEVIDCNQCGYAHLLSLPDAKALKQLYEEEFYASDKPLYFDHYEQDAQWWDQVYRERLSYVEGFLGKNRRSALDIGSGAGLFLASGESQGWKMLGLEPSSGAVAYSQNRGLSVVQGMLDAEAVASLGTFDFIHLSAVLEHVLEPGKFLGYTRQLMADDGVLCVVVPNDFNKLQLSLQEHDDYRPWWVAPRHHLNYFNFDSLRHLLKKAGFEVVRETSTFPMELFLLMGDNYIGSDELGRICHGKRKRAEMLLEKSGLGSMKSELYDQFAALGIGREVVTYARKTKVNES